MTEQFPFLFQQRMYKVGQPTAPLATGAHNGNKDDSFDGLITTSE
jgi:hypothetical protein